MREIITLECTECKNRNYTTTKNNQNVRDRLELKKYCKFCKKHTPHRETR
ncbi:MAG: 50S ribosomal protein L33 [Bacillota bacterium]